MTDIKHRFVTANNIRIHVAEQGEGPLVLLIHGFPEIWYSWRHQLPVLAEAGYRAVAIDQRGYGRSSKLWNPREYRISQLVTDVVEVVRALGEKHAVVVGHDWGAPVAWTAAWQYPELFRAVIGISVPFSGRGLVALPGSPFGELRLSTIHKHIAGEAQDFYQTYFSEMDAILYEIESDVRGWIRDIVYTISGDAPIAPERVDQETGVDILETIRKSGLCIPHGAQMKDRFLTPERLPNWFNEQDLDLFTAEFERTGFAGGLSYYHCLDLDWEELESMQGKPLSVPALFIGGEIDPPTIWGAEAIDRAKEKIPQYFGTVVLQGCGHWIQQERPEETNHHLLDFLSQLG